MCTSKRNSEYRAKPTLVAMTGCAAALLAMPVVGNTDDFLVGKTYGEWAAKWWQWAFNTNFAQFESGGTEEQPVPVDCSAGQQGPLWFLAGALASQVSKRACQNPIPSGKTLFFPLVNYGFWNPDASCPEAESFNCAVEQKRANTNGFFSDQIPGNLNGSLETYACQLSATVDGVPVQNLGYAIIRTQSPVFSLDGFLPDGTPVSDPETIDDGYYVAIPSLGKGAHTIHFTGGVCDFKDSPQALNSDPPAATPIFKVDVTYTLEVR